MGSDFGAGDFSGLDYSGGDVGLGSDFGGGDFSGLDFSGFDTGGTTDYSGSPYADLGSGFDTSGGTTDFSGSPYADFGGTDYSGGFDSGGYIPSDYSGYDSGGDFGGFQHGGSFTAKGSGGVDSVPVSFMATPGEKFIAVPPGQGGAANRAMSGGLASGGATMVSRAAADGMITTGPIPPDYVSPWNPWTGMIGGPGPVGTPLGPIPSDYVSLWNPWTGLPNPAGFDPSKVTGPGTPAVGSGPNPSGPNLPLPVISAPSTSSFTPLSFNAGQLAGGFQTGGAFSVPNISGATGLDPIRASINVQPGEQVTVTPADAVAKLNSLVGAGSVGSAAMPGVQKAILALQGGMSPDRMGAPSFTSVQQAAASINASPTQGSGSTTSGDNHFHFHGITDANSILESRSAIRRAINGAMPRAG